VKSLRNRYGINAKLLQIRFEVAAHRYKIAAQSLQNRCEVAAIKSLRNCYEIAMKLL
jgi:hypothetical protein